MHPQASQFVLSTRQAAAVLGTVVVAVLLGASPARATGPTTATTTFTTAGLQAFTVPVGVTSMSVTAIGAAGGSCNGNAGGKGGDESGVAVSVEPGEMLLIGVGAVGEACLTGGLGGVGGGGNGGSCRYQRGSGWRRRRPIARRGAITIARF